MLEKNNALESKIQAKIIKRLEKEGWFVNKLIKTTKNGIPDLLAHRTGETIYIEVKRQTGKLSAVQKIRIEQLREKGITVFIWTDYEENFIY